MSSTTTARHMLGVIMTVVMVLAGACSDTDADTTEVPTTEVPFQVEAPEASDSDSIEYTIGDDGNYVIEVRFTGEFDLDTMVPESSVFLAMDAVSTAAFSVEGKTGEPAVAVVRTTFDDATPSPCVFDPDCFFTLRLLGSGTAPIRSVDGDALDGDADGSPGGDYETTFVHLG